MTLSIFSENGHGTVRGGRFAGQFDSYLSGVDEVRSGAGNDTLTGGSGPDDFVFATGHGVDRILDFAAAGAEADDIDIGGRSRIVSFDDLISNHLSVSGNNIVIVAGADVTTLVNVRLADLDASDFIF